MDKNDRNYTNGEITVYWKPKECVHAGICFRELRRVFDPARRPWIDMNQGTTDEIIDIVERCPTNALTFERNNKPDQTKTESPSSKPNQGDVIKLSVMRNGPILAEGNFIIHHEDGREQEVKSITSFCRCGMSGKQPFCDGTHNKKGFFPDSF